MVGCSGAAFLVDFAFDDDGDGGAGLGEGEDVNTGAARPPKVVPLFLLFPLFSPRFEGGAVF